MPRYYLQLFYFWLLLPNLQRIGYLAVPWSINFFKKQIFIYLAAPGLSCSIWTLSCGMWDLVLRPGIKPGPLHWECGVLATGPPGKSWSINFNQLFISLLCQMRVWFSDTHTCIPLLLLSSQIIPHCRQILYHLSHQKISSKGPAKHQGLSREEDTDRRQGSPTLQANSLPSELPEKSWNTENGPK